MPSTCRSAGINPAISIPSRRAIEDLTCSASSSSPSISLDLSTSRVSVWRLASAPEAKSKTFHSAHEPSLPVTQFDQQACNLILLPDKSWPVKEFMDIKLPFNRIFCGEYTQYLPHRPYSPHFLRRIRDLFTASRDTRDSLIWFILRSQASRLCPL